jgi:DNA mismatch repair protein MutS2
MGAEWLELGDRLRALGEELDEARRTGQVAGLRQQEAERLCREYEQKLAAFTGWQATERKRLVAEQERLLRDARRQIENLVRAIRESGASHPSIVAAKSHVEAGLARAELANEAPAGDSIPEPLAPGERVESSTFRRRGEVVATEGGKVTVAFGSVRVALDHSDLRKVPPAALEPGVEDRSSGGDEFRFEPRLDIRGLDRLDAERAVGRFVDDAVVAGAVELLILHGTGTGALRRLVQDRLRRDQRVESACAAERAAGGSGVTLVRLRTTAPDVQSGMREGSSTGGRRPAR